MRSMPRLASRSVMSAAVARAFAAHSRQYAGVPKVLGIPSSVLTADHAGSEGARVKRDRICDVSYTRLDQRALRTGTRERAMHPYGSFLVGPLSVTAGR